MASWSVLDGHYDDCIYRNEPNDVDHELKRDACLELVKHPRPDRNPHCRHNRSAGCDYGYGLRCGQHYDIYCKRMEYDPNLPECLNRQLAKTGLSYLEKSRLNTQTIADHVAHPEWFEPYLSEPPQVLKTLPVKRDPITRHYFPDLGSESEDEEDEDDDSFVVPDHEEGEGEDDSSGEESSQYQDPQFGSSGNSLISPINLDSDEEYRPKRSKKRKIAEVDETVESQPEGKRTRFF